MDEYIDLYTDGSLPEDPGSSADPSGSDIDDGPDPDADPDIKDIITDVLDDYFNPDGDTGDGEGELAEDDEDGAQDQESFEDGFEDQENTEETGDLEEMESGDGEEMSESPILDPEVFSELSGLLREHTYSVQSFISDVTVSGNSVTVSLDAGDQALLSETVLLQSDILSAVEGMNGLLLLVLFALLFDLVHRFAKRFIKNLMGGDRNASNS